MMKHSPRGFTLVELGIVIGVLAIMATVVFTARGFIDQSRVGTSVQLVSSVRDAARGWSKRTNGGASFIGLTSIALLVNNPSDTTRFFVTTPRDPWDNANVTVAAVGGLGDFVDVGICIGNGGNAAVLAQDFRVNAERIGQVTVGSACGGAGVQVIVRLR
ncbi:MAG: type II secretion system protein [Myxococcota bacterium]